MSTQNIDIQDVLDYLNGRKKTFLDGVTFVTSREDELQRITRHFMDLVEHAVAFQEENDLDGVAIQIYSDAAYSTAVGSSQNTSGGGKVTFNLVNGTYYFKATKSDYDDYKGSFVVADEGIGIDFTLAAKEWPVTFHEQNTKEGVGITVYTDSDRTEPVGEPVVTGDDGKATIDLPSGTYYYTAKLTDYQDGEDSFVVSGAAKTVDFTMSQ